MNENSFPDSVYIEVTNKCNLQCSTCPRTFFHTDVKQIEMSLDEISTILNQIPDNRRIVLHGLGEPLCHQQIDDIVKLAKSHGHYVLFNTNGLLLNRDVSRSLIKADLDEIRISLNTMDEECILNARKLVREKNILNRRNPKTSFWLLNTRDRLELLPKVVELAADAGIDEVYLQRFVHFGNGSAVEELSTFGKLDSEGREYLREAEKLAEISGIKLWGSGNANPVGKDLHNNHEKNGSEPKRQWSECVRPFRTAYIMADGSMIPCCITPFSTAPHVEKFVLGNVFQDSFMGVWQGEKYKDFRRKFNSDNPWECCRRCGSDWSL